MFLNKHSVVVQIVVHCYLFQLIIDLTKYGPKKVHNNMQNVGLYIQ